MLHKAVLLEEAIAALNIRPSGIYIDATLGRGGHSAVILQKLNAAGRLIAFDQDKAAIDYAAEAFKEEKRLKLIHANFRQMGTVIQDMGLFNKVDGILFDLGICSTQIDEPTRGFSFRYDAALDMRMDQRIRITAADILASYSEKQLVALFKEYGEERAAKAIAKLICARRREKTIKTTFELVEIILSIIPNHAGRRTHPATKVFQALRIAVNDEMNALKETLAVAMDSLAPMGRLAVISFHSLEDRCVKNILRAKSTSSIPSHIPIKYDKLKNKIKLIGKAIKPHVFEVRDNPRARSAVLRVAERNEN